MSGISSVKTVVQNPDAKIVEPEGLSPFGRFMESLQDPLPKAAADWSPELKFKFASALSESLEAAFEDPSDAQWKSALALGFRLLEAGSERFDADLSFAGTKFGAEREDFKVALVLGSAVNAAPVGDGSEKAELEVELAEGRGAPRERISKLRDDPSGVAQVWTAVEAAFPGGSGEDLGSAAAMLLCVIEPVSASNAEDMAMDLDGMHTGTGSSAKETGKALAVRVSRKELAFAAAPEAPRRAKFH